MFKKLRMSSVGTIALVTLVTSASTMASPSKPSASSAKGNTVDLLITGGTVYTGDVQAPRIADVGIINDRIVFIGDAAQEGLRAKKTLDARGRMVAPGFIDAHVHAEDELSSSDPIVRAMPRQLLQGVTTSVIGVDGEGTPDLGAQLRKFETSGIGQNVASYVGFGEIRRRILGESARAPTATELDKMKALAAKGMCEGALGLSSGLFYAPQSFASTEEVIAVAREAGQRGGIYDTHQRDEGTSTIGVVASLKEAIRIGRESGATLHVAHIKVTDTPITDGSAMAELVTMIDAARQAGQPVTADQYPWTAANTGLEAAAIPRWAQDGGREAMLKRFDDPAAVARIKSESRISMPLAQRVLIDYAPGQPTLLGKRLSEIATMWHVSPVEAVMRILKGGEVSVAVFVMAEADIRKAVVQPWVMTSSDGRNGGHPRGFGSFPKVWTDYVTGLKLLTPAQFVHRSSSLAADTFGLKQRGYIKKGFFADITVIDPTTYAAKATFIQPTLLATGVIDVVVNGKIEVENGRLTGSVAGRRLIRTPKSGTCP